MKKHYIKLNLSIEIFIISIVWLIGSVLMSIFYDRSNNEIGFVVLLIIVLSIWILCMIYIFIFSFHCVYIENTTIVYKTLISKKRINLLSDVEFIRKKDANIDSAMFHTVNTVEMVVINSNSVSITIPMTIYNDIKKECDLLKNLN